MRVGILLDAPQQEAWLVAALQRVLALPGVEPGPLVVATNRRRSRVCHGLHRALDALDHRLRSRRHDYYRQADVAAELQLVSRRLELAAAGPRWIFDHAACAVLRAADADVWLCAGLACPELASPDIAPRGAWGLEIGAGLSAANPAACAAEIAAGVPTTTVTAVDYARGRRTLARSVCATQANSARASRIAVLHKACCLWPRLLANEGSPRVAEPTPPVPGFDGVRTSAGFVRAILRQVCRNQWRKAHARRQWQIAYRYSDAGLETLPGSPVRYLVPPRDRFWADPFALRHAGRDYILFEELEYRDWTGRLMAVEVFEDRAPGAPLEILRRPWHLSYPFVFRHDGELYMVPESADCGRVELYRCRRFPADWQLESVLLEDVCAFDATLWQRDDRWWMFVSLAPPGARDGDELHLYMAERPAGPWRPHPANPVKSDARNARPAGPLCERDGALYRPAQDCAADYGHAVVINRVDTLTPQAYVETPVCRLGPERLPGAHCLHTLGRDGRLQVMDFQVWRRRF